MSRKRSFVILVGLLALTAFIACGPKSHDSGGDVSVAGTTWQGVDSDGDQFRYIFQPDGVLLVETIGGDGSSARGTWRQDGNKVIIETGDHYAEGEAFVEGDQLRGSVANRSGHSWTFTIQRVR